MGGADAGSGSGLRGLVDRVEAVGGRLHVVSPPGEGTAIRAELPCEVRSAAPEDSRELTAPDAGPSPGSRRRPASRLSRMTTKASTVFAIALSLIAIRVLDDNFLQPEPGTSPGDHLLSGLLPLAVLGAAAWWLPRASGAGGGAVTLALGVLGVVAGAEALHETRAVGMSGDDVSGFLAIPAGLVLLGLGAATLWRTRRTDGPRSRRYARRAGLGLAGRWSPASSSCAPRGGYAYTHLSRAAVPENALGVAHENVSFETSDGLRLEGWYVPSRNGAAVVAFAGRKGPQAHARMLARHGYGVLLFDRRGEGASEGEPNSYGWGGEKDIDAAVAYLRRRPDVDPGRIGGIGMSVGGELMMQAAAGNPALRAVVSDGAGFRSIREEPTCRRPSLERIVGLTGSAVMTAGVTVFSNHAPPADLKRFAAQIAPRPLLLISDPRSGHTEELNVGYHRAAREPKALWEIPGAGHTAASAPVRPSTSGAWSASSTARSVVGAARLGSQRRLSGVAVMPWTTIEATTHDRDRPER